MRYISSLFFAATAALLLIGCKGGGGGGGPGNPAETPNASTSISMDGYWQCVESVLGMTNTVFTGEFDPGEVIEIRQNQIIGMPVIGESWLRADMELLFGFPLGWYHNAGTGQMMDFHVGWDRLSQGGGAFVDYANYGLRLAATGPNELTGFESAEEQETSQVSRTKWTAAVRFQRINSLPAQLASSPEEEKPQPHFRYLKPPK